MTPEELFDKNKRLAYFFAQKAMCKHSQLGTNSGIEREDIEQIAFIGLWKACVNFKPELGFKFSTYASPKIVGEIAKEFRDRGSFVKVPRQVKSIYKKVKDKNYTKEQIIEEFKCSETDAEAILNYKDFIYFSLDAAIKPNDNENKTTFLDEVLKTDYILENNVIDKIELENRLSILDDISKKIILLTMKEYTQRDIGKRLGLSQVQVSRKLRLALEKINEEFNIAI